MLKLQSFATTIQNTSDKIKKQIAQLWDQKNVLESLIGEFNKSSVQTQKLLVQELQMLADLCPSYWTRSKIKSAIKDQLLPPGRKEILLAKQDLKRNPFDTQKIEVLKELAKRTGKNVMVVYLDQRLKQLNGDNK